MWISRKLAEESREPLAETGRITMNSRDGVEAQGSATGRNLSCFAPYGYCAKLPPGEEVMLLDTARGQAVLGARAAVSELQNGEIAITSAGGAKIELKNDGSVVINGTVIIDRYGEITYDITLD